VGRPPHLPQSKHELEEFFDLSIDLLCIVGFDGYFKRVNPSLERTLGYPSPLLFSQTVFDITHPDDVQPSQVALGQLAEGRDVVGFESRVICADGTVRWLQWNTHTMPERGIVYGVARDVTGRRRADAELREAQQMLEANRDELRVSLEEQGALRRVATLVARETPPHEMFAAVVRELGEVLGVDATHLGRFDPDGTVVSVAGWGRYPSVPLGTRFPLTGDNVSSRVLQTGRPARLDGYEHASGAIATTLRELGIQSSIGAPVPVDGRTWGVITATSKRRRPFPAGTELRLHKFTELLATAISNAGAREKARVLAEEQAALRRVATLVAQGPRPGAVFEAVTAEVADLLDASAVTLGRYEGDMVAVVAQHGSDYVVIGDRLPLGGTNVASIVRRTGRTSRLDDVAEATGPIGDRVRRAVARSAVAAPVVVDGRIWGVLAATWTDRGPPPEDAEGRLAGFAELLDTAIANADSRDQLTASRARVLAASDEARRRVVRDLHDGAQQRLVHTILTLKIAQQALHRDPGTADALLAEALDTAERATAEVRELAHGILPSVLVHSGLHAGVDALASRLDLPVTLDVSKERVPADIEASAYFIVAEALTNVVKHARATRARVTARVDDGALVLEVRDDGVGGADPDGHGLVGIADRVGALGGRLRIASPDREGTVLAVRLPLSTGWPRSDRSP
jgi:PAS domain S-box-containing protein